MKNFAKALFLAAAVGISSGASAADTFNYQYQFENGAVVSGSFLGTASGNLITGLSHITFQFASGTNTPPTSVFGASWANGSLEYVSGGSVMSFNGQANNFLFTDTDYPVDQGYYLYFSSISEFGTISAGAGDYSVYDAFDASRWQVTSAVPELESSVLMLAGLGVLGAIARRRRAG